MLVSTSTFLSRIAARTGLDAEACGVVVELTVSTLASQLRGELTAVLSENLPPTLACWAEAAAKGPHRTISELLALGPSPAHVAVVCGAVAELLPLEVLAAVRVTVQRELSVLLVPREAAPTDLSAWRARP